MRSYIRKLVLGFSVGLVALSGVASATTTNPARSAAMVIEAPLEQEVNRELRRNLTYYSLFDLISYRVEGSKVTLLGQVWWPALKPTAERIVTNIERVTSVDNQIEVLPASFHDDDVRLDTMRALFSNAALSRYAWFGSHGRYGHTRYGYSGYGYGGYSHIPERSDIHIIVKNGDITLEGVVSRKAHRGIAGLLAHGVSGAFSVTNNLTVQDPVKES